MMLYLRNETGVLTFSQTNGALLSWKLEGRELVSPSATPFTIGLRDPAGSLRILDGNEFRPEFRTWGRRRLTMTFRNCEKRI